MTSQTFPTKSKFDESHFDELLYVCNTEKLKDGLTFLFQWRNWTQVKHQRLVDVKNSPTIKNVKKLIHHQIQN